MYMDTTFTLLKKYLDIMAWNYMDETYQLFKETGYLYIYPQRSNLNKFCYIFIRSNNCEYYHRWNPVNLFTYLKSG